MGERSETRFSETERLIRARSRGLLAAEEPLAPHTTIKIGGRADLWFEPDDEAALGAALCAAHQTECPVHVFGGGSNLLVPDAGLRGLVVHLGGRRFRTLDRRGDLIVAGGGAPLGALLQFLVVNGMGDCEFLAGIPAQVGGAVMMNAGSATHWIGEHVATLRAVDFEGRAVTRSSTEIPFAYRTSGLERLVITEAAFHFPATRGSETRERLSVYADYRRKTQDLRLPNAGCMFRNPDGCDRSAGRLIEDAGLKGRSVGGARVSEIHANFAVNAGGARQRDVIELLQIVEDTVRAKFGIALKREIRILG